MYTTDSGAGEVVKTSLDGKVLLRIEDPRTTGAYGECQAFRPTETAIGPNGDIYIADGYGSQFILRYGSKGNFISKLGGETSLQAAKFKQAHGVTLETRDAEG